MNTQADQLGMARGIGHSAPDFRRLYRAHVTSYDARGIEHTAFVEAASARAAVRKIAAVVATLEFGATAESVAERIYNCYCADELIATGVSADHSLRLCETGWSGNTAICFVEHPLFLLRDPAPLCRLWAQIPTRTD